MAFVTLYLDLKFKVQKPAGRRATGAKDKKEQTRGKSVVCFLSVLTLL